MRLTARIVVTLGLTATFMFVGEGTANPELRGTAAQSGIVPVTHLKGGVCSVAGTSQPIYGPTRPSVSPHPLGVEVVWTPGLNDKSCQPILVRGGSRIASSLAFDVDFAPFKPKAAQVVCPDDDNTSARLYFTYGRRRPAERINADLDGCGWISAEGSGARGSTSQFRTDLLTLAPAAWAPYLS
jgi:hypothetical protein